MIPQKHSIPGAMLFPVLGLVAIVLSVPVWAVDTTNYANKDECMKCHPARFNDIATAGGRHRNVPCVGCHPGHPPEMQKPIAQCNRCHLKTKKSHFQTVGCLNCHTNPHTPLKISFKGKDGCLDCHELQKEQMKANPSKHVAVGCIGCHDVHRRKPECVQCHKPHSNTLASVCTQCHNPHMPKSVVYSADVPSRDCGACHPGPQALLTANTSKHHLIACARCHQQKHKMIPTCSSCHGTPHPAGIRVKFPKCTMCHNIAHDLNNWAPAEQRQAPPPVKQQPDVVDPDTGSRTPDFSIS